MATRHRRIWAEVDTGIWRANYRAIAGVVAPAVVMPVVKANAYGLGDLEAAAAFRAGGARFLAVSCLGEGLRLLDSGMSVVLLGASLPEEVDETVAAGLIPAVADFRRAELFSAAAVRHGTTVRVHLKIDTGMGRFGMPLSTARETVHRIAELPGLELQGIFSHFAVSRAEDEEASAQLNGMVQLIGELAQDGLHFAYRHIANSTAVACMPSAYREPFNMVRPGIDLHGSQLEITPRPYVAKPVFALKARLLAVRRMPGGAPISYGRTYRVAKKSGERIGVVSVGYADGYPRCLTNKGTMLVRGKRCRIRGFVCMDYTMISLDNVPDAEPGDEVVVIGRQGDASVPISEVAHAAHTIPYELMCNLGPRVQRVYLNHVRE